MNRKMYNRNSIHFRTKFGGGARLVVSSYFIKNNHFYSTVFHHVKTISKIEFAVPILKKIVCKLEANYIRQVLIMCAKVINQHIITLLH